LILFPDTHFFLHFRHPQDAPWGDASASNEIVLIIGRTVQKELEQKKFELRGRAQERARYYALKLAKIVCNESVPPLRDSSPRVVLAFAPRPPNWSMPSDLDPNWQDDQLIADALAYRATNPEKAVAILTGDSGVLATAKAHGLEVISLAGREWQLPPEPSSSEKELESLKRENIELKRKRPKISSEVQNVDGNQLESIQLKGLWFPRLTSDQIDELIGAARVMCPEATEFNKPLTTIADLVFGNIVKNTESDLLFPSAERIQAYRQDYENWISELKTFVVETQTRLGPQTVSSELNLYINNDGSEPADDVLITFESVGQFKLNWLRDDEVISRGDVRTKLENYRSPPVPPRPTRKLSPQSSAKWEAMVRGVVPPEILDQFANLNLGHRPQPVTKFGLPPDWPPERRNKKTRESATRLRHEVAELRHQVGVLKYSLQVTADIENGEDHSGALKVTVSARNLSKPDNFTFPIRLSVEKADTLTEVLGLIPGDLRPRRPQG
jgi:hypothetical protein